MSRASTYAYVKLRHNSVRFSSHRVKVKRSNLEVTVGVGTSGELTFTDTARSSSAAAPIDHRDADVPAHEVHVMGDSKAPPVAAAATAAAAAAVVAAGQRANYESISLRAGIGSDVVTAVPIGDADGTAAGASNAAAAVGEPTAQSHTHSHTHSHFRNKAAASAASSAVAPAAPARTLSARLRPYWLEARWLGLYAVPLTLTYFMLFLPLPIVSHFALKLDTRDERRAVNLTHGLFNLFVVAFVYGIINTGNCLFAQAFGSADVALMRTHFQRILLTSLALFLLAPLPLLLLVQAVVSALDGAAVAAHSDLFLLILTPGAFGALVFGIAMQLFQAQNLLVNNLAAASLASLSLFGAAYALVEFWPLGVAGLASALAVYYFVLGGVSALLAAKEGLPRDMDNGAPVPQKGLFEFERDALADWSLYVRISLSNAALVLFQSIPFYTAGIMAKGLTEAEARAQEVLIRVVEFYQEVPEGVSSLCTTRIANHVGSKQPGAARHAAVVTLFVHVLFIVFANALILVFRKTALGYIARGKDLSLVEDMTLFQYVMLLGSLFILYNAGLAILNAVGIFTVPAIATVLLVVLFILPLELVLTYLTPLRVHGVWVAFAAGAGLLALYSNGSALRIRWKELSTEKLVQNKTADNIADWHAAELLVRNLPLCAGGAADADDDESSRPLMRSRSPEPSPPPEPQETLADEEPDRLIRKRLILLGIIFIVLLNTFIFRFLFRIIILKYI